MSFRIKKDIPFRPDVFLIDLLICSGIILVVGPLSSVICIAVTGSREEGLGNTIYLAIPLITLVFFRLRRKLSSNLNIVLALAAAALIFGWLKLIIFLTNNLNFIHGYIFILVSIPILITLLKHTADKLFLQKDEIKSEIAK
jgi:hypothetical protein